VTLTVIFDADFLSSFLKISRLDLVREFYQIEQAQVPPAVYREIAQTDLLSLLAESTWIRIEAIHTPEHLLTNEGFAVLGQGEQESIALALDKPNTVLLMSDNKARQVARMLGVAVVNIPAFLLACKVAGLVDREVMVRLVQALRDKDYYDFRQDIRERLLQ
jgi:predicted nucleic acid-binding protein